MKKFIRLIFNLLLNLVSIFSKKVRFYHREVNLFSSLPPGLILINFIFQRILFINKTVEFPVHFTSRVAEYQNISFVKDKTTIISFAVSANLYIQAMNGIKIGNNFLIAPGVKIISANHDFDDYSLSVKERPIVIGDDVWVGANSVILPGVEIGNGCIIGAGSVVTKSFKEDNLIIAGNPAKVIAKKHNL